MPSSASRVRRERIDEEPGRLVRLLREVHRHQVHAVAGQRVAFGPGVGLRLRRALLGEAGVEEAHQRDVEAVEPDHRLVAVVAVVVEGPRRRDDEVAVAHRRALAVDGRVGALAVEHQAQRRLAVAVRRRHLARQDQLQPGVERLGDARAAAQRRVLEHQDASLGLLGGDQPAGLQHVLAHLVVAPERRRDRARRLRRHQRAEHLPERRHVERADALVEGAARVGAARGDGLVAVHRPIVRRTAPSRASPLAGARHARYKVPGPREQP